MKNQLHDSVPRPQKPVMGERTASELWWTLLVGRLTELRVALPATLKGTIQISVPRPGQRALFRYLRLDGPATTAHDGLADQPDLWITLDEDKLGAWLSDQPGAEGALRASGNHQLWRSLFAALNSKGQPLSWLQIRGTK
jgi:hypothetical protein